MARLNCAFEHTFMYLKPLLEDLILAVKRTLLMEDLGEKNQYLPDTVPSELFSDCPFFCAYFLTLS